jgi:hypothetical protein
VDRALIKNFFTHAPATLPIVPAVCVGKSDKDRLASTDGTHYVLPPFKEDEGAVKAVHGRPGRRADRTPHYRGPAHSTEALTEQFAHRRMRSERDGTPPSNKRRGQLGELKTRTTRMGQHPEAGRL